MLSAAGTVPAESALESRLAEAPAAHAREVRLEADGIAGPGAEFLIAEGRAARFFLIGERVSSPPATTRLQR